MKIFVLNSGSSSLKYQLLDMQQETVLTSGLVEKIGGHSEYSYTDKKGQKQKRNDPYKDHKEALRAVLEVLLSPSDGFLASVDEVAALGHRVVHGGESLCEPVIIDAHVKEAIREAGTLAPLHNFANLSGIEACEEIFPGKKQVVVFDTAFHHTMQPSAYLYALPYEYYQKYKVRRYGFHGTSHEYVAAEAARFLGKKMTELRIISCHLGNGASMCAIAQGKSVENTMGLTPLEGLMMGTRSGSLDPAAVLFLQQEEGLTPGEMDTVLNKRSGLLGVSGVSNDLREVEAEIAKGNERAQLAVDMYVHRIRYYIGAYMALLGGVDAILFTAGVGENAIGIRQQALQGLEDLGIALDAQRNDVRGRLAEISSPTSKVKVLLVPTNEELMIARHTVALVS